MSKWVEHGYVHSLGCMVYLSRLIAVGSVASVTCNITTIITSAVDTDNDDGRPSTKNHRIEYGEELPERFKAGQKRST
jgi:hypothetical protein